MKQKITNYLKAGYPGLFIVTFEDQRLEAELTGAAEDADFHLFAWSITEGIVDTVTGIGAGAMDPLEMLEAFVKLPEKSILVARDFHMLLRDANPIIVRKIKDVLLVAKNSNRVLIITGCQLELPPELEKELTVVEFGLPDRAQLKLVLERIAQSAGKELNGNTETLLDAASGLTTIEAENAYALSVVEAKEITSAIVAREKAATIKKNGVLEIVETRTGLDDIGGLNLLKAWVGKRRNAFSAAAKEYGLPMPKGFLLVGIPGCGKSLTAKATANILGCPLLKLDAGRIFGSLVGESERNLRIAIQTAEAIAPCVLWLDEIEKAFAGSKSSGSTDGGTSSRVFGTFLSWLQEKKAPVFVVATANDVSQLPPELLRKGRFDENWFVDLPNVVERADIWDIQLRKVNRFDLFSEQELATLVNGSEGFTGAEIEAAIADGMFAAFDTSDEVTTEHLTNALANTVPLSKMMASEIEGLRQWSKGRARLATSATAAPKLIGRKLAA